MEDLRKWNKDVFEAQVTATLLRKTFSSLKSQNSDRICYKSIQSSIAREKRKSKLARSKKKLTRRENECLRMVTNKVIMRFVSLF